MAKAVKTVSKVNAKPPKKRPGIHSKSKSSKLKASKGYKKRNVGQGK